VKPQRKISATFATRR